MVRRQGIAASFASAAFFSCLILASLYIQSASLNQERFASMADVENTFWVDGRVAAASSGLQALANVQGSISSVVIPCSKAGGFLRDAVTRDDSALSVGSVGARATVSIANSAAQPDNMTSLSPFNGNVAGALDLTMKFLISGTNASAGVDYSRTEVHALHLPVAWTVIQSVCLGATSVLTKALTSSKPSNCTQPGVLSIIQAPNSSYVSQAKALGLQFGVVVRVVSTYPCQVVLTTSIVEPDIAGPLGPFDVSMSETTTSTLGVTAV